MVTFVFLFLLLPRYGILGAAIASLASYIVSCFVLLYLVRRRVHVPVGSLVRVEKSDWLLVVGWLDLQNWRRPFLGPRPRSEAVP